MKKARQPSYKMGYSRPILKSYAVGTPCFILN